MVRRLFRRLPVHATVLVALGAAALVATVALPPTPSLVWNVTASVPIGLYAIGDRRDIASGDMVLARVPERWRQFAADRRYIPINVPLVKRMVAESGDRVCALGQDIFINGRWIAERREVDGRSRPMPWWSGCVTLRSRALFLLADSPDSFDGRYFGSTARRDIIGKASAIWTR